MDRRPAIKEDLTEDRRPKVYKDNHEDKRAVVYGDYYPWSGEAIEEQMCTRAITEGYVFAPETLTDEYGSLNWSMLQAKRQKLQETLRDFVESSRREANRKPSFPTTGLLTLEAKSDFFKRLASDEPLDKVGTVTIPRLTDKAALEIIESLFRCRVSIPRATWFLRIALLDQGTEKNSKKTTATWTDYLIKIVFPSLLRGFADRKLHKRPTHDEVEAADLRKTAKKGKTGNEASTIARSSSDMNGRTDLRSCSVPARTPAMGKGKTWLDRARHPSTPYGTPGSAFSTLTPFTPNLTPTPTPPLLSPANFFSNSSEPFAPPASSPIPTPSPSSSPYSQDLPLPTPPIMSQLTPDASQLAASSSLSDVVPDDEFEEMYLIEMQKWEYVQELLWMHFEQGLVSQVQVMEWMLQTLEKPLRDATGKDDKWEIRQKTVLLRMCIRYLQYVCRSHNLANRLFLLCVDVLKSTAISAVSSPFDGALRTIVHVILVACPHTSLWLPSSDVHPLAPCAEREMGWSLVAPRLVRLLNNFHLSTDFEVERQQILRMLRSSSCGVSGEVVLLLLKWAVCDRLWFHPFRYLVVATVLSKISVSDGLQCALVQFLNCFQPSPDEIFRVFQLFGELIRVEIFDYDKFLRVLMATARVSPLGSGAPTVGSSSPRTNHQPDTPLSLSNSASFLALQRAYALNFPLFRPPKWLLNHRRVALFGVSRCDSRLYLLVRAQIVQFFSSQTNNVYFSDFKPKTLPGWSDEDQLLYPDTYHHTQKLQRFCTPCAIWGQNFEDGCENTSDSDRNTPQRTSCNVAANRKPVLEIICALLRSIPYVHATRILDVVSRHLRPFLETQPPEGDIIGDIIDICRSLAHYSVIVTILLHVIPLTATSIVLRRKTAHLLRQHFVVFACTGSVWLLKDALSSTSTAVLWGQLPAWFVESLYKPTLPTPCLTGSSSTEFPGQLRALLDQDKLKEAHALLAQCSFCTVALLCCYFEVLIQIVNLHSTDSGWVDILDEREEETPQLNDEDRALVCSKKMIAFHELLASVCDSGFELQFLETLHVVFAKLLTSYSVSHSNVEIIREQVVWNPDMDLDNVSQQQQRETCAHALLDFVLGFIRTQHCSLSALFRLVVSPLLEDSQTQPFAATIIVRILQEQAMLFEDHSAVDAILQVVLLLQRCSEVSPAMEAQKAREMLLMKARPLLLCNLEKVRRGLQHVDTNALLASLFHTHTPSSNDNSHTNGDTVTSLCYCAKPPTPVHSLVFSTEFIIGLISECDASELVVVGCVASVADRKAVVAGLSKQRSQGLVLELLSQLGVSVVKDYLHLTVEALSRSAQQLAQNVTGAESGTKIARPHFVRDYIKATFGTQDVHQFFQGHCYSCSHTVYSCVSRLVTFREGEGNGGVIVEEFKFVLNALISQLETLLRVCELARVGACIEDVCLILQHCVLLRVRCLHLSLEDRAGTCWVAQHLPVARCQHLLLLLLDMLLSPLLQRETRVVGSVQPDRVVLGKASFSGATNDVYVLGRAFTGVLSAFHILAHHLDKTAKTTKGLFADCLARLDSLNESQISTASRSLILQALPTTSLTQSSKVVFNMALQERKTNMLEDEQSNSTAKHRPAAFDSWTLLEGVHSTPLARFILEKSRPVSELFRED